LTLQPTSPLRSSHHIDSSIELFTCSEDADSLVSCIELPHIFNPESIMLLNGDGFLSPYIESRIAPTRRQEKRAYFARNGAAIYITRTARLREYIFGGRLVPYIMGPDESVDIDSMHDLMCAERIIRYRGNMYTKDEATISML